MSQPGPVNPYLAQSVEAASPVKLVELLYDGFLRFSRGAIESISGGDVEAAHNNLLRCYAIVAELQATLDPERGGSIARDLERCYDFVLAQLREADITKQSSHIHNCIRVIEPLADAWRLAHAADVDTAAPAVEVPTMQSERPSVQRSMASAAVRDTPPNGPALDLVG